MCFFRLSSILKAPYLLHEDLLTLLAPSKHSRIKCEKTQINNSFESILDKDVPYSIVVENITAEETRDMFKAFPMHFSCTFLYIYIIYSIQSIGKSLKHYFAYSETCFELQISVKWYLKYK